MKKIALIVGHSEEHGGATNYKHETEFEFNSRVAKKVKAICDQRFKSLIEVSVFRRFTGKMEMLRPDISLFKPNMTLELHFNAFEKKAFGCEMLVYKHAERFKTNVKLADLIMDRLETRFDIKQRHVYHLDNDSFDGVKVMSEGRGVRNLRMMHDLGVPYAMLIEPTFGNFETAESKSIFEREDDYVDFLVNAIGYDIRHLI